MVKTDEVVIVKDTNTEKLEEELIPEYVIKQKSNRKKDKKKKKKERTTKIIFNVSSIKEEKNEEVKTAFDKVISVETIVPKLIEILKENNAPEEEDIVIKEMWTEVNMSKHKKKSQLNKNKNISTKQRSQVEHSADISTAKSCPEETPTEVIKQDVKESVKPLKEIKELFFQDKSVEIVQLAPKEVPEKSSNRKTKLKTKSKRAFLSDAKKQQQTRSINDAPATKVLTKPLPLSYLVFQPLGSFLEQQGGRQEEEEQQWTRLVAPPVGLSVRAGGSPSCPLEDDLVQQRVITRREKQEASGSPRPLVMIRDQGRGQAQPGVQVPGPRLRYSSGEDQTGLYILYTLLHTLYTWNNNRLCCWVKTCLSWAQQ